MSRPKVRFAEFEVNFAQQELRKAGVRVRLQHKPFQILELLLQRPGQLVSRQELARSLWPGLHVSFERGLNTAVNVLRQTLGDSSHQCRFIETRSGLGYRFIERVEEVLDPAPLNASQNVHEDYLKGRYFLHKMTDEALWKAIAHFESALVQDSQYALAYAGLADAYCQSVLQALCQLRVGLHKARQSAAAALLYDAGLPETHVADGHVKMLFDWDWDSAGTAYRQAVELGPHNAEAHRSYAAFLSATGSAAEALSESAQALHLNPLSCPISAEYAWHLYLAGDFQGAAEQCWKVLTLEPVFSRRNKHSVSLTNSSVCKRRPLWSYKTLTIFRAIIRLQWAPSAIFTQQPACGGEAMATLQELDQRAQRRVVSPYWYTLIHAGLGETKRAVELLEIARRQKDPALLWVNVDPRLSTLIGICV